MYPISYEADFNPTPNRWTTFFRILLAIPWIIVMFVYLIAFIFTHFFAWVSVVILGRYPQWLYDFNSGIIRFMVRTGAWIYLQTDVWPPFGIADDPSYPIRVNFAPRAERQSRLKAFFRLILVIPMEVVIYFGIGSLQSGAAAVAWLAIVFRGYMPEGINSVLTYVNGFYARVAGYATILTDDYPPIGLEASRQSGDQTFSSAATQPPAPPAPPAAPAV